VQSGVSLIILKHLLSMDASHVNKTEDVMVF